MKDDINILLGNGFNLALDLGINFNYEKIFGETKNKVNERVNSYLKQDKVPPDDKTSDLEKLLYVLSSSQKFIKYIDGVYADRKENCGDNLNEDIKSLKKAVIEVMTAKEMHPQWSSIFDNQNHDGAITICKNNLSDDRLKRIFTINYDLILYWLIAKFDLFEKFKDGFSREPKYKHEINNISSDLTAHLYGFSSMNNQMNLIFLHGALHLLSYGGNAYKVVRKDSPLDLSFLRERLLEHVDSLGNLIVFEASSHKKMHEMMANNYLTKAYDKLLTTSGALFVYGTSFSDNTDDDNNKDMHLWDRIINSEIHTLYIGANDCNEELASRQNKIRELLLQRRHKKEKNVEIYCFCQKNYNIWTNENFFEVITNDTLNRAS